MNPKLCLNITFVKFPSSSPGSAHSNGDSFCEFQVRLMFKHYFCDWSVMQYHFDGLVQERHNCSLIATCCPKSLTTWHFVQKLVQANKKKTHQSSTFVSGDQCHDGTVAHTHWVGNTLKWNYCYFDEIFITGCTGSCHFDNLRCSQWLKLHFHSSVSAKVMTTWTRLAHSVKSLGIQIYFLDNSGSVIHLKATSELNSYQLCNSIDSLSPSDAYMHQ